MKGSSRLAVLAAPPVIVRHKSVKARIAALEPKLSRLRIVVSAGNPEGLTITQNGAIVGRALWGSNVPVDPGTYAIRAEAPGHVAFERAEDVRGEGQVTELVIPVLEREPVSQRPARAAPVRRPRRDTAPGVPRPQSRPPLLGWTALGIGVVGLGVGTYFGLRALDKKQQSDAICNKTVCPPDKAEAVDLHDQAVASAWISDVALGVGIGGVSVGTFLLVTHDDSPPKPPVALAVQPGGASVKLEASW